MERILEICYGLNNYDNIRQCWLFTYKAMLEILEKGRFRPKD